MGKYVILWDNDIGWCEKLRRGLLKEGIQIAEIEEHGEDDRQELPVGRLAEMAVRLQEEELFAVVLSVSQLQEAVGTLIPYGNGHWVEILREICDMLGVPVILIAEESGEVEELAALRAGACDYVYRDRDIRICIQRILLCAGKQSVRGRQSGGSSSELFLDKVRQSVRYGEWECALTRKEYLVLAALLEKRDSIVTREELFDVAWKGNPPACGRVIDTVIKQLRAKLKETPYVIQAKYKRGYYITVH